MSTKDDALTGGSSNYYKVECVNDRGDKYTAECKHIINAKNMNFNVANVFKACYRLGGKNGTTDQYDLEKCLFFITEELRRRGYVNNNKEVVDLYINQILGDPQ